jgi:hypothetical protein
MSIFSGSEALYFGSLNVALVFYNLYKYPGRRVFNEEQKLAFFVVSFA